ncbi:MAG: methyltransferase domain-containing protein [Maricaulis sp.]|nr:methyltransferase domain-containing protein [Maricaulis sp.]
METNDDILHRYESVSFESVHRPILHRLPKRQLKIIDIGSGSGRDSGYLARQGHCVRAVEPNAHYRTEAARLHPSPLIDWADDRLPNLAKTVQQNERYDIVLISAVWMHLDQDERCIAMPIVAGLLNPTGLLVITLRHGSKSRPLRMFEVSSPETKALAAA